MLEINYVFKLCIFLVRIHINKYNLLKFGVV
jgi:hypothetical protein